MKKNVKKLGALLLAGAMAVSTVGCMPTSKPQESTGEQNAQASDATQGTEEPAAPEGLEVDTCLLYTSRKVLFRFCKFMSQRKADMGFLVYRRI